ncbi:MAG: hypothetical protein NTY32_11365, partial [Bacteroidia bacterium]|nr:hypothetical protein [Bacteroidia bacterium]
MQIHISKITHRDAQRLLVAIPYTNHNIQQIKQIPGATFSRTLNSWHIPFTKDAYSKLSTLFPHDEFIKAESTQPDDSKTAALIVQSVSAQIPLEPHSTIQNPIETIKPDSELPKLDTNRLKSDTSPNNQESQIPAFFSNPTYYETISIEVAARRLILRMPKNDTDVQFVLTFRFAVWNAGIRAWIIPHYKSNLDIIIKYFGTRMDSVIHQPTYDFNDPSTGHRTLQKETLLVIKTRNNRLR